MIKRFLKQYTNPDAETLRRTGLEKAEAALVQAEIDLERAKAEVEFLKACVKRLGGRADTVPVAWPIVGSGG